MIAVRLAPLVVLVAACAGHAARRPALSLRPACPDGQRWTGDACAARPSVDLAAIESDIDALELDRAMAALDRAADQPLEHARNVKLWELRGTVHGYLEHEPDAVAAFRRVLELDPGHHLDYQMSAKATFPFERAREAALAAGALQLEVGWPRDARLGAPVPIELEVINDPPGLLSRATLYIRTRGTDAWQATDIELAPPGKFRRALLPAVDGREPTNLEVYAVATDGDGNETLLWASPTRPREIPLRYDPPTPWYRKWWVWAAAGGVVAAGTGAVVYATVWEPSGEIGGHVTVR